MLHLFLLQRFNGGGKVVLIICFLALFIMLCYFALRMVEMAFVMRKKRPLYRHLLPFRKLTENQLKILESDFVFYKKLEEKERRYFEHRVASLIKDKFFIGREGLEVTDEMKVLISATAAMLTFGFRDFYIGLINKIFIYPDEFYSKINDEYHKGEFNPRLQALVISWNHFKEGFEVANDNVNLGIHEFTHAIHLNSIKERDVSSTIFEDSFKELVELISNQDDLRKRLIDAEYFREYAFTNQFEFLAVIVETFIESPQELKNQFPQVYSKVQQMLNFNFAGY
ncbi:MAG: zinc-dependent peptidase [Bacteroidia bacterium]|nr:zinc-dependent peptidase [Bacteroidia bacterium]MBT8268370.1 zinc-dependent peptidase [Bacteroidia bacterium]NNK69894.1 hypothetical protein [Flavobacteriaceae bacterium]NNL80285.1 hypothetical protein [Flavobacteriaceae bacterium]